MKKLIPKNTQQISKLLRTEKERTFSVYLFNQFHVDKAQYKSIVKPSILNHGYLGYYEHTTVTNKIFLRLTSVFKKLLYNEYHLQQTHYWK